MRGVAVWNPEAQEQNPSEYFGGASRGTDNVT
jgi:hypothetical protein